MDDWWDYLNPFAALGNAAASVVVDGWTAAMLGIWNAGLWMLKLALTIEDAFLVPDLSANGPMGDLYGATFWIAGAMVLLLFLVQLGIAAVRRDGQSVGRVLLGVGQFGAVWVMWIVFAVAILAAAGGLTRALTQSLLGVDSISAWEPWTGFSTADLTDGTVATVLGVLGIFVVFAAVAHLLVMLARGAALMVLAATNPVSAAGLVWDGGRSWFWKTLRWFLAAAFTPVLMILILGLGVKATSGVALSMADSLQTAIGTAVPGVVLIFVSSFAPLALFKLLAFVDPGTSSGSAMRAGLAAQGGWQGLLNGRADGASTSDAASSSDASGQSIGEGATEAATNDRFTRSAGGLLGALGGGGQMLAQGWGMAQGLGSQAAAVGADLTNQMGVGHNTYIPDFSGSRSRPGQRGRSRDDDTPDINGSGPDDDAGFGPNPSATGKPPVGGTPTGGTASGTAGDAAGGAGGGAAAAPEVAAAVVV